jgi:hypothetical protein
MGAIVAIAPHGICSGMHFGQPQNHKRQSLFEWLVMIEKIIRLNMAAVFEVEAPT